MRLPRITKMPDNGFLLKGVQTPAAAGTNQATGTQITAQVVNVTAADGTKGVVLPSALRGMEVDVINTVTTAVLKVYPFTGDSSAINALAADAAFSIPPGGKARFTAESKTQWRTDTTASGVIVLPASTATVPVITFTTGTLLTTAAVGAVEFDGTAFYATAVASARQQIDAEQFVIASADSATYNNTGLDTASAAPVFTTTMGATANGAITLAAGKVYAFEFQYNLTNTGTTSHTWAVLFAGTATFTKFIYSVYGLSYTTANVPATGGLTGFVGVATAAVVTAASTSATEQVTVQGQGILIVNAGGTLIPQMIASARPGATGTPGVVVKAGSFFRIWEMSSSVTVGNWS